MAGIFTISAGGVRAAALAGVFLLASAPLAQAQTVASDENADGMKSDTVSQKNLSGFAILGGGVAPEYEGSEDYSVLPIAGGQLQYGNYYAQLLGPSLKVNVLDSKQFNLGPLLGYRGGRDDDVENDAVSRLSEIDSAVEAGLFARMNFRANNVTRHRAGIEAAFQTDVSDAHDGWLLKLGADYSAPIAEQADLGLSISTIYASDDYMQTFFGVDATGSAASGLRQFNAEGGFKDITIGVRPSYSFNRNWGVFGMVNYSLLLADAADSPIVEDQGDNNQVFAGMGINYRF